MALPRPVVLAAIIKRDFSIATSYRTAFLFDLVVGVLNLMVFYFISKTLGRVTVPSLGGAPNYFAFAAVGMILTLVISSASVALARRVREEQLTGTLEALFAQPVTTTEIGLGLAGFPFLFSIVRVLIYLSIAVQLFDLEVNNPDWIGLAIMLLVTGAAMGAIGLVMGGVVVAVKRGESFAVLLPFALGFFGGNAFPRSVLPGWAQAIGSVTPTRFAFDGTRDAMFLGTGWTNDAIGLVVFAVVTFPLALILLRQTLLFAIRRGTLGQY